jgi:hypothetical protein
MGSKRGPLSKAEVFYITQHAKDGVSVDSIATDLDRPIKSIEKCYTQAKAESSKPATISDQLARQKGCVVMTENASAMVDSKRKGRCCPKSSDCVTKIKED